MRLSKRLKAIAELIPSGARICDVGTDHALLPCALISSGKCGTAVATDISKNCIARAAETARASGIEGQVRLVCCDGISGVDASEFDTLVIAGMGGETIVEILESGKSKLPGKTLILSAHTKQTELLSWLRSNGFAVRREVLVRDRRWTYLVQVCEWENEPQ